MTSSLHKQIWDNLNLKETDELLEIWQTNDRSEWSDEAFNAIKEILDARGAELPEQDEPTYEHTEEDDAIKDYGFSEEELKIIDDEEQPVFYDPFDVLLIKKRIEQAAIVSIVLVVISSILRFPESQNLARSLLQSYPPLLSLAFPIALISLAIGVAMVIITTYIPLKALAHILRILMEMEFNSRK